MDKYLNCLKEVNDSIRDSSVADFEFTNAREAATFAHFTGSILPVSEEEYSVLESELGELIGGIWNPLLSIPSWYHGGDLLLKRKYVTFAKLHDWKGDFDQSAFGRAVRRIQREGHDPSNFILYDMDREYYTSYDEGFWEYLAGCYLRKLGYIVSRWTPLGQVGAPDLTAFAIPDIAETLSRRGIISGGAFACEIDLFRALGPVSGGRVVEQTSAVVLEAESAGGRMYNAIENQLKRRGYGAKAGYLGQGFYDEGLAVGPDFNRVYDITIVSNTEDGGLYVSRGRRDFAQEESRRRAFEGFSRFIKLLLVRNADFSRLLDDIADVNKPFWAYAQQLAFFCQSQPFEHLVSYVSE